MAQLKAFASMTSLNADKQAPNKRVLLWRRYLLWVNRSYILLTYPELKPFNYPAYRAAYSLFKPPFTLNLVLNDTAASWPA